MKRVLVTGGAGFIGSHTVDLLLKEGLHVIVIDNLATGKESNLDFRHPNLEFIQEDFLNYPHLFALMSSCDAVVHLAALASVSKTIEDPLLSLNINLRGFLLILQAIREIKKPLRLVYASSAAVYGGGRELPCSDHHWSLEESLSPYALEKANNERYAKLYSQLFGIKSIGFRYFNVYGPRQDPESPYSGVISRFVGNYQRDFSLNVYGDGKQSRDFIHVFDVAKANLLALKSDFCGILNIGTGIPSTLNDLVCYIEQAGGRAAKVEYQAPRIGDIRESFAKVEKAVLHLNFRHSIDLPEGIRLLMND